MIKRSVLYSEWERETNERKFCRFTADKKWTESIVEIFFCGCIKTKQEYVSWCPEIKLWNLPPGAVISIQSFIPSFFHPLSFHTHYFGTKDCFLIQLLQTVELVENIYVYIFPTHWRLDWCPKLKWPMTKTSDLSTKSLSSNWADIFFYS